MESSPTQTPPPSTPLVQTVPLNSLISPRRSSRSKTHQPKMAESMDDSDKAARKSDIPLIKLARVQKIAPFLLVKHVRQPSENNASDKKTVFNCKCSVCGKSFATYFNLHRHLKRVHKLLVLKLRNGEFTCDVCQRSYTSKKNLASHISFKHKTSDQKQKHAIICPECHFTCRQREQLRKHISDTHGVVFESKELTFSCRDEFDKWKAELEKEDNTKYVRFCGKKKYCPTKWREYHFCHRTGVFKRKKNVTRRLKQNGSCKIGGTCPATIIVAASSESEELQITLWGQHFGHGPDAPLVKDGPYKRIRSKPCKKNSRKKNKTDSELDSDEVDALSPEFDYNKPCRKYKRKKRKTAEEDLNAQDPLLLDDVQLVENEVPVIISSEDHAADNNSEVFVHPLCIISSSDINVTEVMEVEIEAPVPKVNVAKIARKNISPQTRRKNTARKSRTRKTTNAARESPASPVTTYSDVEDDPAEVSRSMLFVQSPVLPEITYSDTKDDPAEANRSMLFVQSPASPVTTYSDNEDDTSEVSRSILLDQINQLRHIVLNKNITDQEQLFTLKKLNDCIQMFKDS